MLIARLVEELSLEGDLGMLVESVERAKAREAPPASHAPSMSATPLATLLAAYEARCREVNAFDFTDLLGLAAHPLRPGSLGSRKATLALPRPADR